MVCTGGCHYLSYFAFIIHALCTVYNVWQAGLTFLVDNIDFKYFNKELGKPVGFVGFLSPFYNIGTANYQSTGKN